MGDGGQGKRMHRPGQSLALQLLGLGLAPPCPHGRASSYIRAQGVHVAANLSAASSNSCPCPLPLHTGRHRSSDSADSAHPGCLAAPVLPTSPFPGLPPPRPTTHPVQAPPLQVVVVLPQLRVEQPDLRLAAQLGHRHLHQQHAHGVAVEQVGPAVRPREGRQHGGEEGRGGLGEVCRGGGGREEEGRAWRSGRDSVVPCLTASLPGGLG